MNEIHEESTGPLCQVQFTKSSTKDGGWGYKVDVFAGCPEQEADAVFVIALRLKEKADEALKPKSLITELMDSIDAVNAAPDRSKAVDEVLEKLPK